MAKSFLDISGLPLGLRNNNPGNLRPLYGGLKWVGEIAPDTTHGFSRFSNITYGLRAMVTDLLGDIKNDGKDTIRKLISSYAPPSENDTTAYMTKVSQLTGLNVDAKIPLTSEFITKLVKAQLSVELGPSYAAKITNGDISEAIGILSPNVKSWLTIAAAATGGGFFLLLLVGFIFRKKIFGK